MPHLKIVSEPWGIIVSRRVLAGFYRIRPRQSALPTVLAAGSSGALLPYVIEGNIASPRGLLYPTLQRRVLRCKEGDTFAYQGGVYRKMTDAELATLLDKRVFTEPDSCRPVLDATP